MAAQSSGFNLQFSHDGAPAAGFLLYAFVSGTNTAKDTFQDAAEAAAHAHPIELDDQGRIPGLGLFLLTDGAYDFELRDPDDVPVKAWEGYSAVPAAADSSFVPLEGGVAMTGQFELSGPAEDDLNPVPLNQVQDLIAAAVAAAVNTLNASLEPVGVIKEWMTETIPTKHLWLNGDAVSRATYADLFALWGVTFGVGDGTTTFNLPDRRGRFVRGYDPDGTVDPDGGTRTLATQQGHAFEEHNHSIPYSANGVGGGTGPFMEGSASTTVIGDAGTATETRPVNLPTIWIVRAQL
jgi:microcystin-dependent protein